MNGTDDATETNAVSIRRDADGRVVAVGGDESAPFMLQITGFVKTEGSADTFVLTEGLETYQENEAASEAAVLLVTAGYDVTLDPGLGVRPSPPPFVPTAAGRMSSAAKDQLAGRIDDITDHLVRAKDPAEARRIIDVITGEGGVLDRTARTLRAASSWADYHHAEGSIGQSLGLTAEILTAARETADHASARLCGNLARAYAARARTRAATAPESSRPVSEPTADTCRPAPPRSAPSR